MKHKGKIQELDDDALLELYRKEGQSVYFAELYKRYIPLVYGLCLKYLGNQPDAQDAVMDIYEDLTEKATNYEIRNFYSWLYSVAKNHCYRKLNKGNKVVFVNFQPDFMENEADFTLIDGEKSEEEENALNFCMNELGKEQRKSIELFYYENKSYLDIAELTGYTLDKVKSYIQNGKRNLKNCILRVLKTSSH